MRCFTASATAISTPASAYFIEGLLSSVCPCGARNLLFSLENAYGRRRGAATPILVGTVDLKCTEQSFPANQAGVHQRVRVGEKSLANLAGLPGVRRNVERHIDHHRRSDDVVARHAAPKTAVVRVAAIVAHHKITVGGHCEGLAQVVGLGASGGVVFLERSEEHT